MSTFRGRLMLLGFPLLEIVTIYLVAQLIGWGWTFLLLLAAIPVGFAVMRNAGDGAMRDLAQSAQTGVAVDASRHTLTFVGGLLIMIPGFWTDLMGALLAIPLTQRLFHKRTRGWIEKRFTTVRVPGTHYPGGDVIQGTVIQREEPGPRPDAPQLPPSP